MTHIIISMSYQSTKIIELGSCAFRQWRATHSHCRFLHGYQLKAKLWFGCSSLDDKNWCVDFGGLKELKAKLQHVFDHTTTVAADDPELSTFEELDRKGIIQLRVLEKGVGIERVAEVVHSIANNYIKSLTNERCWVDKVEVFEHEENSATFTTSKSFTCGDNQTVTLNGVNIKSTSTIEPGIGITEAEIQKVDDATTTHTAPSISTNAAHVGPNTSQGMGNLFAGTSWG
jgi:6-pyruvoyltetrahydropterin/6-carboxytetrahydropterin synthase